VIPLLLTSLVYAGSFVARLWVMSSSCGRDDGEVGVGCTEKLARWMQTSLQDVMVWRNYVVVCSQSLYPLNHSFVLLNRCLGSVSEYYWK
jgi:hypothetical protein